MRWRKTYLHTWLHRICLRRAKIASSKREISLDARQHTVNRQRRKISTVLGKYCEDNDHFLPIQRHQRWRGQRGYDGGLARIWKRGKGKGRGRRIYICRVYIYENSSLLSNAQMLDGGVRVEISSLFISTEIKEANREREREEEENRKRTEEREKDTGRERKKERKR